MAPQTPPKNPRPEPCTRIAASHGNGVATSPQFTQSSTPFDSNLQPLRNALRIQRVHQGKRRSREPVVPKVTIADLTRVLNTPELMPKGWTSVPAGSNHWRVTNPQGRQWTVTTDRGSHDYAPDRVEWWGPGSPSFP